MSNRRPFALGRRELLAMLVGVLLYGGMSWLTNSFLLTSAAQVQIGSGVALSISVRPAVAVPIFFGLVFGPIVGFVTGAFGNLLGDSWSGYLVYPPEPSTGNLLLDLTQGYLLNWQVGNGLMGLIAGLVVLYRRRFLSFGDQLRALLFVALGIVVGMGFASFTDMFLDNLTFDFALRQYFIPVVLVNLANALILVPILLFNYARLDLHSLGWFRSGLMRRLLLIILISAAVPMALASLFLVNYWSDTGRDPNELMAKLGLTILLMLLFTIANAALVAQWLSRPLLRVMQAAQLMEADQLGSAEAAELEAHRGKDEISRLCQSFGRMARQVILRQERLRQRVEELSIEIDQAKRARQVAEITETEYFQQLQQKAEQLRRNSQPNRQD